MGDETQKRGASVNWWLRAVWGIAGALWFFWIGVEDPSTITVFAMSATALLALAATGYHRLVLPLPSESGARFASIVLLGLMSGLLVTPTSILLMALKTALHDHVVPDFVRADVIQVLGSTPAWAFGGLMLAAAGGLYDRIRTQPPAE